MSMGRSVERRGVDDVLDGYATFSQVMFSLWGESKQLKFSFDGTDKEEGAGLLRSNLEAIDQSGSQAIYTLRVHTATDKDGFISDKTSYAGSFNFKLNDNQGFAQRGGVGTVQPFQPMPNALILEKLEAMNKEILELKAQNLADDDEEPMTAHERLISGIGQVLEIPVVKDLVMGIAGKFFGNKSALPEPAILGTPEAVEIQEDEWTKINTAINVLYKNDPKLSDHLVILANKSIQDPEGFKFLLSMLK